MIALGNRRILRTLDTTPSGTVNNRILWTRITGSLSRVEVLGLGSITSLTGLRSQVPEPRCNTLDAILAVEERSLTATNTFLFILIIDLPRYLASDGLIYTDMLSRTVFCTSRAPRNTQPGIGIEYRSGCHTGRALSLICQHERSLLGADSHIICSYGLE